MPDFAAERLSDRDLNDLLGYLTHAARRRRYVQAFRPADEADLKVRITPDVVQASRPAVTSQDLLDGLKDPTRWLTVRRRLHRPAPQPADADHARKRRRS